MEREREMDFFFLLINDYDYEKVLSIFKKWKLQSRPVEDGVYLIHSHWLEGMKGVTSEGGGDGIAPYLFSETPGGLICWQGEFRGGKQSMAY